MALCPEKGGYWERLIDRPQRFGKMKARFAPGQSPRGHWWCPPCVDLLETKELWIVEGIFDCIALLHHGIAAVSAMSSAYFPEESLKELARQRGGKLPRLVWALDNEPGAHSYTRKHVALARELGYTCEAAQIPQRDRKADWNDLHQRWAFIDDAEKRADKIHRDLAETRYHGALLLAESAAEKGVLMYEWRERYEFPFGFEPMAEEHFDLVESFKGLNFGFERMRIGDGQQFGKQLFGALEFFFLLI